MWDLITATLLVTATAAFAILGLRQRSAARGGLDDYLIARNRYAAPTGVATLLASTFGAWLLFSPAEAATRGGIIALLGYGLGVAAPRVAMIPLGLHMRRLMPHGRSLIEYVRVRYGPGLYVVVLIVMVGYLAVLLAAEATATAKLIGAVSDLPAWLPAAVTLGASLVYTRVGGLHASIVTDRGQFALIVPFLVALAGVGVYVILSGGAPSTLAADVFASIVPAETMAAWESAAALFLAILLTGVLSQGNWQRVFAMRDAAAVRHSLLWAALISAPVVILVGGFGILHTALALDSPSAAVFAVLRTAVPPWTLTLAAVFGVALVLSTMDTAINAIASLTIVVGRTARPTWERARLLRIGFAVTAAAAAVALVVAIQGYSVLYLFLCADLLCAATAVPVFAGLYLPRYSAPLAAVSLLAGLAAGVAVFPDPAFESGNLLAAFALAVGVPALLVPLSYLSTRRFDPDRLAAEVVAYHD